MTTNISIILSNTPIWVYALFFVLIGFGIQHSRTRQVRHYPLLILPCTMILLSIYGVISAFGVNVAGPAGWVCDITIAVGLGLFWAEPKGVTYCPLEHVFNIPGSWAPLLIMMGIFFTKYAIGVITARQLPIAEALSFRITISMLYGFFSGLFLSRLLIILRSRNY